MGLVAFNVVLCIAKKTVFRLQDGVFLAPVSELPVNVNVKFVFDCGDYAVAVLASGRAFDLKCFHGLEFLQFFRVSFGRSDCQMDCQSGSGRVVLLRCDIAECLGCGRKIFVACHCRFRWFSLRRPCGPFILHGIKEKRRFIFIYFQWKGLKAPLSLPSDEIKTRILTIKWHTRCSGVG